MTDPVLTLIVPVYNEQEALPPAYERLDAIMKGIGETYEVIIIDNGSFDRTEEIAQNIVKENSLWRYIRLSRNFTYQNSISAAMTMAHGQAMIVIDVDLQDPPEMITDFVKYWREGYDIVYGIREKRFGEPALKVWATMIAMRFVSWMADYDLPTFSGDFRLISRRVRDVFMQMPENNRYVRGMIHWVGFKQKGIPYERQGRQYGRSATIYGIKGVFFLLMFTLNAVFAFSLKPLRVFSLFGIVTLALAVLVFLYNLVASIIGHPQPGILTLIVLMIVQIGITSLGIGVLGEYLGRTYTETKRRPLWIVDYALNFDDPLPTSYAVEQRVLQTKLDLTPTRVPNPELDSIDANRTSVTDHTQSTTS